MCDWKAHEHTDTPYIGSRHRACVFPLHSKTIQMVDMVSFKMISLISSNVMQDQTMSVQCVCANIEMYTTNDSRSHQNEWLKSFVCVLQNGFCSVVNWVNFRRLFDEKTAWTTQFSCNPDSIWLMEMDPMSDEQARRRKYQAWLKYVQSLCMPSEYRAIHKGLLL